MTTIEQKQSEIEMFLTEKEAMRRLRLEQIISGKRRFIDYVGPVTMTAFSLGGLILLGASRSLDISAVIVLTLVLIAMNAWNQADAMATNRQMKALKEYIDMRLTENKKETNA